MEEKINIAKILKDKYSNDELNILKNLLERVLCEVNGYIHL